MSELHRIHAKYSNIITQRSPMKSACTACRLYQRHITPETGLDNFVRVFRLGVAIDALTLHSTSLLLPRALVSSFPKPLPSSSQGGAKNTPNGTKSQTLQLLGGGRAAFTHEVYTPRRAKQVPRKRTVKQPHLKSQFYFR